MKILGPTFWRIDALEWVTTMSASSGELAEPSPSGVGEPRQRV